jgi:hypothetical protein
MSATRMVLPIRAVLWLDKCWNSLTKADGVLYVSVRVWLCQRLLLKHSR